MLFMNKIDVLLVHAFIKYTSWYNSDSMDNNQSMNMRMFIHTKGCSTIFVAFRFVSPCFYDILKHIDNMSMNTSTYFYTILFRDRLHTLYIWLEPPNVSNEKYKSLSTIIVWCIDVVCVFKKKCKSWTSSRLLAASFADQNYLRNVCNKMVQ